uniref:Uncharacterized protein n=1 Tax=Anguilla anguilla TaxID=7936 RepID=A0A0E9VKE7_ANGAN
MNCSVRNLGDSQPNSYQLHLNKNVLVERRFY